MTETEAILIIMNIMMVLFLTVIIYMLLQVEKNSSDFQTKVMNKINYKLSGYSTKQIKARQKIGRDIAIDFRDIVKNDPELLAPFPKTLENLKANPENFEYFGKNVIQGLIEMAATGGLNQLLGDNPLGAILTPSNIIKAGGVGIAGRLFSRFFNREKTETKEKQISTRDKGIDEKAKAQKIKYDFSPNTRM